MAFVSGEAGIGKSALVEAFLASPEVRASPTTVWVASGLCIQQHGYSPEPYMPVLEALDRLARRPDAGGVTRLLRHVAPMWLAQIPWLGDGEAAPPEGPQTLPVPGTARMLREFAAFVESLTASGTLVLVLEDLHWSDPSTVDLLSLLGQRRDPARLLVIGTYRPAEVAVHEHVLATVLQTLRLRHQCVEMPLHELARGGRARVPRPALSRRRFRRPDSRPWSTSTPTGTRCSWSRSSTTCWRAARSSIRPRGGP